MPKKYFHIVNCPLSKRQRFLYEDYIGRRNTREQLASGSFLSMMGVLMQLRKVCNHPDLFETRPITTPFICEKLESVYPCCVLRMGIRGKIHSHSFNQAIFYSNDLTDESLDKLDWRNALRFFPSDCRSVSTCEESLFWKMEEDCVLSVVMRNEMKPKPASFIKEVFNQQRSFSPFNELLHEVEVTEFNYRYGSSIDSDRWMWF